VDLSNMLSGITGGGLDPMKLTSAVGDLFASKGGVDGLISTLRAGGLGGVVDSWISTGSNEPAEPAKLGAALGPDILGDLAQKVGLPIEALLPLLAGLLPMIIDHLTPGGKLPEGGGTGSMGDLGGVIGGILGGGGLGDILGGLGGNKGG
jgi:uncharacterized protein YidB (DUF937 family)